MVVKRMTLAMLLVLASISGAAARNAYPAKPVRLVVPAAPGGNPDVLARVLGQKLTERFAKPFIVENVPGAGGIAAAELVTKSAADGHVLMLGDSGGFAVNVALNPDLSYQPLRDFAPITALAAVPTVLVVHPSVPASSVTAFIALAKASPGRLTYGSAGPGSIHHLTMAVFAARTGIELLHVPYRGGTALVAAALSGEIHAGWSGIPNVLGPIHAGTLRVLCISTAARSPSLPDLPTAIELGYDGFDIATVIGLQAVAGTPRDIVERLQSAVARALREPDVVERMATLGMALREDGTESYRRFLADDIARYAAAVKAAGVKSE